MEAAVQCDEAIVIFRRLDVTQRCYDSLYRAGSKADRPRRTGLGPMLDGINAFSAIDEKPFVCNGVRCKLYTAQREQ